MNLKLMKSGMMNITNDDRLAFLCTLDNRFVMQTRETPFNSFIWDQWDGVVYASGINWCDALDTAILKWRQE